MSTTPPPSYPENTLLTVLAPTAFGQTVSYIIQGGQARRIHDTQTLGILAALYGQPQTVTPATISPFPPGPISPPAPTARSTRVHLPLMPISSRVA